jgi:pimeloyl-ACP methyl ester carboxylesterase
MKLRFARLFNCMSLMLAISLTSEIWSQDTATGTSAPAILKQTDSTVEVGELNQVPYRIDLPNNWNHRLIVMHHGYSVKHIQFDVNAPASLTMKEYLRRGYAVIQSAYADVGWALDSGFRNTEELRSYFEQKFGRPTERYVVGGSMGGALTMETIERNPEPYIGGLNLCGAVGSTMTHLGRRFAQRAAFDYYFPDLLPPLDRIPSTFAGTPELTTQMEKALDGNPGAATALRELTGLPTNSEVARMMIFYTVFIGDLESKAGGIPVDNRNTVYGGTSLNIDTDYALNDGVRRYTADPAATQYVIHYYEPTGKVTRPVLALHTVYDANVPVNQLTAYHQLIDRTGYGQNYVQQYVHRRGHCAMTSEQIGKAFDELVAWTHGGKRPPSGLLP